MSTPHLRGAHHKRITLSSSRVHRHLVSVSSTLRYRFSVPFCFLIVFDFFICTIIKLSKQLRCLNVRFITCNVLIFTIFPGGFTEPAYRAETCDLDVCQSMNILTESIHVIYARQLLGKYNT